MFSYDEGLLTPVQTITAYDGEGHGSADLHLSPDGRFLFCACRDSDRIEIYCIEPATGALIPTGKCIGLGAPVCVQFLPEP